ncbi:MAG: hypothetical protein MAG453_00741 [Calditrichaeota bacterium]|nr:hypothetical protein [Calditrichota bacterium]
MATPHSCPCDSAQRCRRVHSPADQPRGQARTGGTDSAEGDPGFSEAGLHEAGLRVAPNPFNAATVVTVTLPAAGEVTVTVYNVAGRAVATLADGATLPAGSHPFTFDASELASGLYFARATVPGHLDEVRKLLLVR